MIARRHSLLIAFYTLAGLAVVALPSIAYRLYADFLTSTQPAVKSDFWSNYPEGVDPVILQTSVWAHTLVFSALVGLSVYSALKVKAQIWSAAHPAFSALIIAGVAIGATPIGALLMLGNWLGNIALLIAFASVGLYLFVHRTFPVIPVLGTRRVQR